MRSEKPDIVAVTSRDDLSADLVVLECERRGVHLYRFNSEEYPARIGFSLRVANPTGAELLLEDGRVSIGAAKGIWLRRPQWPQVATDISNESARELAFSESVAAMAGFWRLVGRKCVSDPDAQQAARWKLPQLRMASRLGLVVPDTIVTTNANEIAEFRKKGPTVIKAVGDARAGYGPGELYGFTEVLTMDAPLVGAHYAPVLLQRMVNKVADVRITVVGTRAFAVKIVTPSGAPLDFRDVDPAECTYELLENGPLSERCIAFTIAYGLKFGAFDFAEGPDGTHWFLECNPNGQWGWLEPYAEVDITGAITDLLLADDV